MRIQIAERLKPFSHEPGTFCILPGSSLRLQVFPAFIRVHDLQGQQPVPFAEILIDVAGPVQDFTVLQDLEHGKIIVWGHAKNGFFRYHITSDSGGKAIGIWMEKAPKEGITINSLKLLPRQSMGVSLDPPEMNNGRSYVPPTTDRLSLGWHKAQDWTLMRRRMAMEEIMPLWLRLGQLITPVAKEPHAGTALLMDQCRQAIASDKTLEIIPAFQNLFLAGFEGMLSPRLTDEQHQGFGLPDLKLDGKLSPLVLLLEGARLIRSLFAKVENGRIHVLPALPPEFHCGRLLGLRFDGLGMLDMEWSKKAIRRIVFHALKDGDVSFEFQQGIKSFRLREGSRDRGHRCECSGQVQVKAGRDYYLDNFMR